MQILTVFSLVIHVFLLILNVVFFPLMVQVELNTYFPLSN